MTDQDETPTECWKCHRPLKFGTSGQDRVDGDNVDVVIGAKGYCVNHDCSESGSDLAPMSENQWLNTPGSMGGASGGA